MVRPSAMRDKLRRLYDDRRGAAAIEFVFVAPMLIAMVFSALTIFNAMREADTVSELNATIADIMSRYTEVDDAELSKLNAIYTASVPLSETAIRVTSLRKTSAGFDVEWSYAVAPFTKMTNADIPTTNLPNPPEGETVILSETTGQRNVLTSFGGLRDGQARSIVMVRPRYINAVRKTDEP